MENNKLYFVFLFLSILFVGCNGDERIEKWPEIGNYYDSSKPVAFEAMAPDWGRINESFVIKGNFPIDTAQVKVYFADKEAIIVNNNGRELYGLVPKQAPGYNEVTLEVDGKKYTSDNVKFKYYQTQSVKTVLGKFDDNQWLEGAMDEFRLTECTGIVTVAGQKTDNFIFLGGGWGDRTYFVSLEDNMVMRLINIGYMGAVAVDNSREKVSIMPRSGGAMYTATRVDGWTLNSLGLTVPFQGDCQGALAYAEDDRYVYAMSGDGLFEIDLEDKSYVKLFDKSQYPAFDGLNTTQWRHYLTYSKYDKCFFASYPEDNGILKIWKDASDAWQVERYAGFQPGWLATAFGDRLTDAVLKQPCGMAVNSAGELYVCCKSSHCIVKIKGRLVSLVAGTPDKAGKVNGFPTDAYFDNPLCIAIDSEENFFIGEEASRAIRKMTIE